MTRSRQIGSWLWLAAVCVIAARPARPLRGEDVALVPLEAEATDILEALTSMEAGRHREAIEILEHALGRARALGEHNGLLQVPGELARSAAELRQQLGSLSGRTSGALLPVPAPGFRGGERRPFVRPPAARAHLAPEAGRRYLPLGAVVEACLGALPPEGLAIYRQLNDELAAELLEAYRVRGDLDALRRVATELFYSSWGDDASEMLGDVEILQGRHSEALAAWRRAASLYPDPGVPAARVNGKIETLAKRLGLDRKVAERRTGALPASRWGGEAPAVPVELDPGRGLALSWDSWGWSERGIDRPHDRAHGARTPFLEPDAAHFPFCPLVDGDRLYLSSVFTLYELDSRPDGGAILAEIRKPSGTPTAGKYEEREGSDSGLYTTTLWKLENDPQARAAWLAPPVQAALITSYVSDAVSPTNYLGYDITVQLPIRSLAAYDAATKRLLWQTGASTPAAAQGGAEPAGGLVAPPGQERPRGQDRRVEAGDEGEDPDVWVNEDGHAIGLFPRGHGRRGLAGDENEGAKPREFSYTSPAVVKAGRVIAGGWIQQGSINSALRALSLQTGRVLWHTVLSGFQMEQTMFGEIAREPFAGAILEADDVVYYLNQGGVVAAVEVETGAVRWLTTYDTIRNDPSWQRQASRRALSWGPNPLVLLGHVLIVTPRDSDQLYAIDTGTGPLGPAAGGRILWRYRNRILAHGQAELRDLAGLAGGYLYFTGPGELRNGTSIVTALDLRGLDALGRLPDGESPVSLAPYLVPGTVVGPGRVTSAGVVIADPEGLQLVELDLKGARRLTSRPYRPLAGRSYPGRIAVEEGRVYMVSRKLISAYAAQVRGRVEDL